MNIITSSLVCLWYCNLVYLCTTIDVSPKNSKYCQDWNIVAERTASPEAMETSQYLGVITDSARAQGVSAGDLNIVNRAAADRMLNTNRNTANTHNGSTVRVFPWSRLYRLGNFNLKQQVFPRPEHDCFYCHVGGFIHLFLTKGSLDWPHWYNVSKERTGDVNTTIQNFKDQSAEL